MSGIWKYHPLLPSVDPAYRVYLGEGNTPLVKSKNIGPALGLANLYFKLETINPSGSYKDRFAAAAVACLRQKGTHVCLATSSGNTGAALAAYCAAAGLPCLVVVVEGTPAGKMKQMQLYGAETLMVKDFGKDQAVTKQVFETLQEIASAHNSTVQVSAYQYAPEGMVGIETIAFELAEGLADQKAQVFSPAGGGGLTLAVAKGFVKWKDAHPDFTLPSLHCVQPEGNNTIAGALAAGEVKATPIPQSTTAISGLQVPNVIDGNEVLTMCRALGGTGQVVRDEEVFALQQKLATQEGIYCEPAGAVALAGAVKAVQQGIIPNDEPVICLITGHGFKDPASVERITQTATHRYFNDFQNTLAYINTKFQ